MGSHPVLWGQLGSYLIGKIKKISLMKHNANDIILSCCHQPVSFRSLVDGVAPLGMVSHRFNLISCN